jgi:arylformamidase
MQPRLDPAWLDAQYNAPASIPDAAAIFERWVAASALARSGSPSQLDIAYGSAPREKLDVFPAPVPNAPVLVYVHGGYWRARDKSQFSFIAPSFNADGAMVVVPGYTLCPEVTVEQITLQLVAALAWTWRNAARFGGDPSRIVVAGHSAGGHLAAMLLSCRWKQVADDLPAQLVGGALSISGLYDLEPLRHAPFLQPTLQLTPSAVGRLSPAFFPRPKGRLYTVVGGDESSEFLRQNRLIRDVWGPTAVPVCETVPGRNHITVVEGLADPAARLHELALRLLGLR